MNAIVEIDLQCPHCGEVFNCIVDTTEGDHSTIEDCPVCCRPINLAVRCGSGRIRDVTARSD